MFSGSGFDILMETDIVINVGCAGSWCGRLPGQDEAIYFLILDEARDAWTYQAQACGGYSFPASDEIELLRVTR